MNDSCPLATEETEKQLKAHYPLEMSPEEYAARQGYLTLMFSMDRYRYRDEQLDLWIKQLGAVFRNPERMIQLQEEWLTTEELAAIRKWEDEAFSDEMLESCSSDPDGTSEG